MYLSGGSTDPGHGLHIETHANNSHAIYLNARAGYGIYVPEGMISHRPGVVIEGGDSAAFRLTGDTPSYDSLAYSPAWKTMVGRTMWYADTSNAAWNGDESKFGTWNAKAQKP